MMNWIENHSQLDKLASILQYTSLELAEIATDISTKYTCFPRRKTETSVRWINAPKPELKECQRRILESILYARPCHECAHGFVPNRSIVSNAKPHVQQQWIGNFDIKSFFPSTTKELVQQVWNRFEQFNDWEIQCLTEISCLKEQLPQGAPTSPYIANLVLFEEDEIFASFAQKHGLKYTRYADDLTFSGPWLPKDIVQFIRETLTPKGYRLAPHKIHFYGQHQRQMVTGLVVNEHIALPRPIRKRLRAVLHDIESNGVEQALEKGGWEIDQLMGWIALPSQWDPKETKLQIEHLQALLQTTHPKSTSDSQN